MEISKIKDNKIQELVKKILDTFLAFKAEMELVDVIDGLHATYIRLKTKEPIRMSIVKGFEDDISYALGLNGIEIEAPVKGSSLISVNIPKENKISVLWKDMVTSSIDKNMTGNLIMPIGKDELKSDLILDLHELKNILISGCASSGKSTLLHTIINTLIERNSPEYLKLVIIDPKQVEQTIYNKIPHLLTPVITDAKKAILSLKWAAKEMNRRYDILAKNNVRDIDSYHKNILAPLIEKSIKTKTETGTDAYFEEMPETMPYIIIVLDEIVDVMQTYPKELESAILKLVQMSHVVGIHLIISTSQPNIKIISRPIRDSIPSRIVLRSTLEDSKMMLGNGDAVKLEGGGDLLFQSGLMKYPIRGQSAYISIEEIKKVVKTQADAYKEEVINEVNLTTREPEEDSVFEANFDENYGDEYDELYEQAKDVVIATGKASTSYIQRKLGVGYSRSAKLIDLLEQRGVVGPANGSSTREVYSQKTE